MAIFYTVISISELKNEDTLKNDIIKELLMHLDDKCVVYCPLSLGDHVAHVFVNSIGRALEFMRYKVIYYEDFPYVSDSSMVSYMGKTKELKMYQEELDEKIILIEYHQYCAINLRF